MQPLFLKIFHRGLLLKTKPFTDDQISIGSGEGLNLQLEGLSSWHVLIEKKLDRYFVFDLGSEEGTFIDGERVNGEIEIVTGAKIQIGEYEIQFFIGSEKLQTKPPASSRASEKLQTKPPVSSRASEKSQSKPAQATSKEASEKSQSKPAQATLKEASEKSQSKSHIPSMMKEEPLQNTASASQKTTPQKLNTQGHSKVSNKKGYWKTFAPASKIQNLDNHIQPSIGNLIEVTVAWKERILLNKYFHKQADISMGSHSSCDIPIPNLLEIKKYTFLSIKKIAQIHLNPEVKASLIQGKKESTRKVVALNTTGSINIKPYEVIKLNIKDTIQVYIRTVQQQKPAPIVGLLNFSFTELASFVFATLLTGFLIFYASFYAPIFLINQDDFLTKDIRTATVTFQKKPQKAVEVKLGNKNRKAKRAKPKKVVKKLKKKIKTFTKKRAKQTPVKIPARKKSVKKSQAQATKVSSIKRKVKIGSIRPGGSIKTGKAGSSAKTVAPDPSKVGLLGVFGGGGSLQKLDQGASGSGGLVGLAQKSTGYAGTEESYEGKGVGSKTKTLGSGGKGTSLVGISNYKTKGRGAGLSETGTGTLGSRGSMSIEFGTDDIDVEGEIDKAGILKVIRKNRVKFDNCYQFSLQEMPSAQGSLKMQWDIRENGTVRSASAVNDLVKSAGLRKCVANVLKSLNFPAPPVGQIPRVAFKFIFSI